MSGSPNLARQMWHLLEPLHAVLYYAPEAFDEAAQLGYATQTRWPSYFAWRSAPLGAAGPRLVAATCYSFRPQTIAAYVPTVWATADPSQVLAARTRAADRALRARLGEQIGSPEIAEAAALARAAATAANTSGRPLAAANADLPWPEQPHLQLWHAATVLREHRGDGHVTALIAAGLDPCEALVSLAATGAAPIEVFASRGWTEQEWATARDRLHRRGWLDRDGQSTELGARHRADLEERTDELASGPWQALGAERAARLAQLTAPLTRTIATSGILPRQSTLGISAPDRPTSA